MAPVLDSNNVPLMPCTEKRAMLLMDRKQAKPYWQKGIFCIKLRKEPSARNYQPIVLGIDPGSRREGYTVATEKAVVLNITTNTPRWVKKAVETRRILRRSRRQRKTPYRQWRGNRATLKKLGRLPPSTKAYWDAKLRTAQKLSKFIPITKVAYEDVSAVTKKGKRIWNLSFAPLQNGKKYLIAGLKKLGLKVQVFKGYSTFKHRGKRGFAKLTGAGKMKYEWESHNVDSHSLCEMAMKKEIEPFLGLWRMDYLRYHTRVLHKANFTKGGIRREDGKSISMGMPKGSVLWHKGKLCYLGGTSKGKLSTQSIETGVRISQTVEKKEVKMLYTMDRRVQFLPRLKPWVSLHNLS